MKHRVSHGVLSAWLCYFAIAGGLTALGQCARAEPASPWHVVRRVDLSRPLHRMAGGIGVSWHAIRVEFQPGFQHVAGSRLTVLPAQPGLVRTMADTMPARSSVIRLPFSRLSRFDHSAKAEPLGVRKRLRRRGGILHRQTHGLKERDVAG